MIKDSGARTEFDTGAVRDIKEGKGRVDLVPGVAILRLSKHFEEGAKKYGEYNWQKGIPIHSYIDSALRHLFKYLDGRTDEDHLCAATWNLMCAMWTEEKRPEMQDIPTRIPMSVRIAREVEKMQTKPLEVCGTCKHYMETSRLCANIGTSRTKVEPIDRACMNYEQKETETAEKETNG